MTVDGGRDRLDDTFADTFISGELTNFPLILLSQTEGSKLILFLVDVVCFDDSREDWETVLRIEGSVEVVPVDTRYFLKTTFSSGLTLANLHRMGNSQLLRLAWLSQSSPKVK